MSRLTNRILLAALLGLFLTAPGIVRSQGFNARTLQRAQQRGETGNLYGTNPYEQTNRVMKKVMEELEKVGAVLRS